MTYFFSLVVFSSFFSGLLVGIILEATGIFSLGQRLIRSKRDKKKDRERKISLSREQRSLYQRQIESYLRSEKAYLNTDFRMSDMVEATGIPRHHLSITINTLYRTNFNTLINRYRIKYILSRFDDPKWNHLTLEGVAEEAGFNSRTTFLNAFKKVTGMTPSKFRKKQEERKENAEVSMPRVLLSMPNPV